MKNNQRSQGTENKDLVEFYFECFSNSKIQEELLICMSKEEFSQAIYLLGRKMSFSFTYADVLETVSYDRHSDAFDDIEFENEWEKKVAAMGWAPLGFVR